MQYMLIMNESTEEFARRNHPEHAPRYWGAWNTFLGAMRAAGIIVNGDALLGPETATTVLMVSHDPTDARRIAPLTILVADGWALPPAPTAALLDSPPPSLAAYLGK